MCSITECSITRPIVLRPNLFFTVGFLYVLFCVICVIIPNWVDFGQCLCFAFTFSMIQMLQVGIFMRTESIHSFCLMALTLVTGCIFPTMQMYAVIQKEYSVMHNDIFAWLYMLKEMSLCHITAPRVTGSRMPCVERAFVMVGVSWMIIETLVYVFVDQIFPSETIFGALSTVVRFSPQFCVALLTLMHLVNKNDSCHAQLPKALV